MQELSKKGITFTIKESLTFPYVQKYIHQHNLQWQKKRRATCISCFYKMEEK